MLRDVRPYTYKVSTNRVNGRHENAVQLMSVTMVTDFGTQAEGKALTVLQSSAQGLGIVLKLQAT